MSNDKSNSFRAIPACFNRKFVFLLNFLYQTLNHLISVQALIFVIAHFLSSQQRRPRTNLIFLNKELCTSHATENQRTVVIIVLSARAHFNQRKIVRQTYGSVRKANNVKVLAVVFMIGNQDAPGQTHVDFHELEAESDRFGDIVMGDFVDSYRNLTLKTIMAYEWLTMYCREAQLVVKTDDDVVVNIFALTKALHAWTPTEVKSSNIWCCVHTFYFHPEEFNGTFPLHSAGYGYVTPFDVIDRIDDEISKSFPGRVFTHEDVFMTSVVTKRINSNHNAFWREPKPIELVDQPDWYSLAMHNGTGDEDHFLGNVLEQMLNETENYDEYRRRYEKTVFYLLAHSDDFEQKYRRLWELIEFCFYK